MAKQEIHFKGKTFIATFDTGNKMTTVSEFIANGSVNPKYFYDWLSQNMESIKSIKGNYPVVIYTAVI